MGHRSRIIPLIAVAASILMTAIGCNRRLNAPSSPQPGVTGQHVISYQPVEANNRFALDLYQKEKSQDGNIFFSPFSITSALAMTYEGARNKTAREMQAVFYLLPDPAERKTAYSALFDEINKPGKNYTLKTANNLWLQTGFPFYQSYLDVTSQAYRAELTNMDFQNEWEACRQVINQRVEEQTEGRIKDLLPEDSLTTDTRLVLTNAIYFLAKWLYPFTAEETYEEDFFVTPSSTVRVQMMHEKIWGVVEDYYGKARVLELPYLDHEVSMFVFLPEPGTMAGLEGALTGDKLDTWFSARTAAGGGRITLALPKFKFESSFDMKQTLSDMGMPTAFDKVAADLTGMADLTNRGNLYISKVVHKAFVAVDEEGTEAAAATGVVISEATSIMPTTPFRVDHPFIFMIRESAKGTVLFMGRVNAPSTN